MALMKIRVTDRRKKYEPKTYDVEADSVVGAYAKATNQYIADNKHPPYKPGQRMSVYFSRFWNEKVEA